MSEKKSPSLRVQRMETQGQRKPPVEPPPDWSVEAVSGLFPEGTVGRGWKIASEIVKRFQPVPRRVWPMVHSVYGRSGKLGDPDPIIFSAVASLVEKASFDKALGRPSDEGVVINRRLEDSAKVVGTDVAASLVFTYAVCRKASIRGHDSVIRPILDDSLLRARLGYMIGKASGPCGPGRGMLAGISGRIGLAIQMAAGSAEQAATAVAKMADKQDISEVCDQVYGCDPLEVAALTLISAGCSRDIAYGVANFSGSSAGEKDSADQRLQVFWCNTFSLIEYLRTAKSEAITQKLLDDLDIQLTPAELISRTQSVFRKGHGWRWIVERQVKETGPEGLLAD